MKIGVFTQPLRCNYGGILQNYAIQVVLKRLGHEPWTIDYFYFSWFQWCVIFAKYIVAKIIGRKTRMPLTLFQLRILEKPLRKFVFHYIQLTTPRVKSPTKRIIEKHNFDVLLVGSDQTWRPRYNHNIYDMYLKLAENMNVKRLAYAASFGTDKWEYTNKQEAECARLVKLFNGISVREVSGVHLCKEYLKVEATHVLDPVLLLSSEDYNNLCGHIEKRSPFVFAYILDVDERKVQQVKYFASSKNLPYLIVSANVEVSDNDSIEAWLANFRDAVYVITDSFHGTAFSIIFKKDFFVYGNVNRGNTRFDSLLTTFNLKHRMVTEVSDAVQSIEWDEVNLVLNSERNRSVEWLNSKLH